MKVRKGCAWKNVNISSVQILGGLKPTKTL